MADTKAFNLTDTIKRYGSQLFGFIKSKVGLVEDAEDILQDVWYQYSNLANPEEILSVSGWLYRVAKNRIIDRSRKQKNLLLDDLLKESFYLTERNANYRQALDGQLALRRKELSPMLEISDTAFIKKMLMRGGGVSFLPRFAVEDDIEKKKLTLLDVKDIEITMYRQIFYHKNKFKTKEMEKFAEFALEDN